MGSPFTHTWVYPSRTPGFTLHEHMGSPFTNTCVHPSRTHGFTLHEHMGSPFTNTWIYPSRTPGITLHEHLGSPFMNKWVHPGVWWVPCCPPFKFSVLCILLCLSSYCARCCQFLWIVLIAPSVSSSVQ
jgi:hypothetical protein